MSTGTSTLDPHRRRRLGPAAGLVAWLCFALGPLAVDAAEPAPTHRALRDNVPATEAAPTAPETFAGYAGAPPFTVVPQQPGLTFFPCSACHGAMVPNPQRRKLDGAPHPAALHHGAGRIWCLDCHQEKDRDHLHTLAGTPVGFDEAYLVCGQCHANRQRDWYFGAHGKRVGNWQGERVIYNCTHCHDPHDPTVKPRAPSPPPPLRAGLGPRPAPERGAEPARRE